MKTTRLDFVYVICLGLAVTGFCSSLFAKEEKAPPNIIWLMAEDIGPDLSCYGARGVVTPHLDALAAQGTRFTRCFTTSPVCSPSRSAMMTGMYQNSIGAHQHRTDNKRPLPPGVRPITHLLRDQGYFTALGCGYSGKTDLNFTHTQLFDGKDWAQRQPGQPFFAQITLDNTHRRWRRDMERPIDPASVDIPPYYPDHPLVRRDWANGLEEIQIMDRTVGKILRRLEDEGIADNTVVIFIGDNGRCHIRGKQFLYDGGLHVPLIIRWPGTIRPDTVNEDLVSTIDISAAILGMAGCTLPAQLQGRDFLNPGTPRREALFAARDKMDDTHDSMRAVRTQTFKYILNLMPERAYCQFNEYKEKQYPVLALMNVMHLKGQLTPAQDLFMQPGKPAEELYNLESDPHEIHNLAQDPACQAVLEKMRSLLAQHRTAINDPGVSDAFRRGGWPATYPTRTLPQWESLLEQWEGHLLHGQPRPNAN